MRSVRSFLVFILGTTAFFTAFVAALFGAVPHADAMPGAVPARVMAAAEKASTGRVRVIVRLDVPAQIESAVGSPEVLAAQRGAIAASQDLLVAEVAAASKPIVTRKFETIPYTVLEVDAAGLAELEKSAVAVEVFEDRLGRTQLLQSVPMVGAPAAWQAGLDGSGYAVAVLDSGVDSRHPFLAGRVVAEACFSVTGSCPNGQTQMVGAGAGQHCNYSGECAHGTHVAGIVAGKTTNGSGVAPGAGIVAVQVFSRYDDPASCAPGAPPCARTALSDQMAALEWVYRLRNQVPIAAVNMSLGFGQKYVDQPSCDASVPGYRAIVENLKTAGIATIAAAGNEGFGDGLGYPACLSNVVSVGAVDKHDQVANFSNSAPFLTLLAPGVDIESSTSATPISNALYGQQSGTSQAAPHVAGAWAILRQKSPEASVLDIAKILYDTGKAVTDSATGVTTPRIRIDAALGAANAPGAVRSGLQTTPDGLRILVNKAIGSERWAITRDEYGTVTGNIFFTDGGPPQFVGCDPRGTDASGNTVYGCAVSASCASSACPAAGDWQAIPGDIVLPDSFFRPRPASGSSASVASTERPSSGRLQGLATPAGNAPASGLQISPSGTIVLVNKRIGDEQWAITRNLNDGTVTGNVYFLDGGDPVFLACRYLGDDGNPDPSKALLRYACSTASQCQNAQCPAPGDWTALPSEISLPASFFLPRGA